MGTADWYLFINQLRGIRIKGLLLWVECYIIYRRLEDHEMDSHHFCMMNLWRNGQVGNCIRKESVMQEGV